MTIFQKPFFQSNNNNIEEEYKKGVLCLQNNDFYGAHELFKSAADAGHISALYNLSLLNGSGLISPYNIDYAIQCFQNAANGGHPIAKEFSFWIDKADDASFGTIALSMFAAKCPSSNIPNHILMMVGCRLYHALCSLCNVKNSVIQYELDAASCSEYPYVHNFINRTKISSHIYSGGMTRIESGSDADQITDGLNNLFFSLKKSGHSDELCIMIRCTIIGYIISKSDYANSASQLLGIDKFFR